MSSYPSPDALREHLALNTHAIQQLQTLLEQERELLETRDHSSLAELIDNKNQLQETLADYAQQRQMWLQESGQGNWTALLESRTTTRALIPEWQTLGEQFAACQELNEINGRLINRSRQSLANLFSLLRGQVGGPQLYTASGNTTPQGTSHSVTKA